ncbi:MAG: hypothetical protein IJS94_08150 [Clostridia bacterium]|nr:hypothetical protein [Clostridia bacterium]
MTLYKQLLLIVTGLSVSFAVHTANYHFYEQKPTDRTGRFIGDVEKNNEKIYKEMFTIKEHTPVAEPEPTKAPTEPEKTSAQTSPPAPTETKAPATTKQQTVSGKLAVPPNMSFTTDEFQKFKGTYLEKSTKKFSSSYYDGVVWAGDSLTYGLGFTVYKDKDIVAYGGLGVYDYADYNENPSYNKSDKKNTPLQWLSILQPEVLYIQLGTNGIPSFSNQYHINLYNKLLDRIVKVCPKTKIVIVSIPPWGKWKETDKFDSDKVDHYNMYLLELAYNRGFYFLNSAEAFRDSDGSMKKDLCRDDGIHWSKEGQKVYVEYLESHPIPGR